MVLRFCDSFDHYATAEMAVKWSQASVDSSITTGRFGSGLRLGGSNSSGLNTYTLSDNQATLTTGFAFKINATLFSGQQNNIAVRFLDSASIQSEIRVNATTKKLELWTSGFLRGTGTTVLATNIWYYVEMKTTFHATTGTSELRVNGVAEVTYGPGDTISSANAYANVFTLGPSTSSQGGYFIYDDVYLTDGSGSANTGYLGDVRVEALFPNANGTTSQLTGQDADSTDNYLNVDEVNQDGDTTYNESSTVGNKDTYGYTNLTPGSGTVYGIQILPYAKKTDAGARSIVTVARLSATETDGPTQTLTTTYDYLQDCRDTKPGGGAWSVSDVNSAEFGVKVVT